MLSNIIEQERQERQELLLLEEMDKLKAAPTLHMASYVYDQGGTKRALSPAELRKISRSAEYHQAFTNYHHVKKNAKAADDIIIDNDQQDNPQIYKASISSSSSPPSPRPCSNTVKKLYQLQDRIISGQ
jgi:hypothetical protein